LIDNLQNSNRLELYVAYAMSPTSNLKVGKFL